MENGIQPKSCLNRKKRARMSFIEAGWDTNTAYEKTEFTSFYEMNDLKLIIKGEFVEEVSED